MVKLAYGGTAALGDPRPEDVVGGVDAFESLFPGMAHPGVPIWMEVQTRCRRAASSSRRVRLVPGRRSLVDSGHRSSVVDLRRRQLEAGLSAMEHLP